MRSPVLTALIIATALFMENMDGTVISTSLPAIARDLHQDPIVLKLALTSYMLTLAVFIPASGWIADRFGARTVFCSAIVVFTLGSILCGASSSLPTLIAARVFQGLGGAMMVPVGRLVLSAQRGKVRSRQRAWPTSPCRRSSARSPGRRSAASSPPISTGAGSSGSTCRSAFSASLLSLKFIAQPARGGVPRFDFRGFVLSGLGLLSLISGLSMIGRGIAPSGWSRR